LEAELLSKKEVEHEETVHLEKAMEQVEDNLKRSTVSTKTRICISSCKLQFLHIDYIMCHWETMTACYLYFVEASS